MAWHGMTLYDMRHEVTAIPTMVRQHAVRSLEDKGKVQVRESVLSLSSFSSSCIADSNDDTPNSFNVPTQLFLRGRLGNKNAMPQFGLKDKTHDHVASKE